MFTRIGTTIATILALTGCTAITNHAGIGDDERTLTYGRAPKIPTLLYGKSSLAAALLSVADPALLSSEDLAGKKCYRLKGRGSDVYSASGHEVNIHTVTFLDRR